MLHENVLLMCLHLAAKSCIKSYTILKIFITLFLYIGCIIENLK